MKLCVEGGITPLNIDRLSRFTPHETSPNTPRIAGYMDPELIWTPAGNRSLFSRMFSEIQKKYNLLRYFQFIFIVTCVYIVLQCGFCLFLLQDFITGLIKPL